MTVLLLTAVVASVLGYFHLLGRFEQLKQELVNEQWQHPRFEANTPSGCFDIHCVLRTNPSDATLYTLEVKTGEPHSLGWTLDGNQTDFKSYWSPHVYSHCSELSLAVIPMENGLVAVTVLINITNRLAFTESHSSMASLLEPTGTGYGSGGYYEDTEEPRTLIDWNGEHKAKLLLHFNARVKSNRN